ncbi:hypothetical protein Vadar_034377 [Vaccinium darrowii]|uniref:Uncharacterized protein n=1 Tax=Vaccinium darrowii TaxID=229202 RepID=A0ACB7XN64_9ERIC|nr:hypothetical protein Vadar_034377 [Vaccinium darrowii]
MWKDKSPGIKILWIWTIGTAAIMVTNVARTRMRDMEKVMNTEKEPTSANSAVIDASPISPDVIEDQKSSEAV